MTERRSPNDSSTELSIRQDRESRSSTLPKGLFAGLAGFAVALVAGAWFEIASGQRMVIERERQRLEAVAELKGNLLARWLVERQADALVSARGLAVTMRELWRSDRDPVRSAELIGRLGFLCRSYGYESAEILDPTGRVVLGFPERAAPGARVAGPQELRAREGQAARILFDEGVRSSWSLRISAALRAADADPEYGWLVLTIDPAGFVDGLLSRWPGESASAEVLLVRRDGDLVTILGARHGSPAPTGGLKIPVSETERVGVQGALGQSGFTEGLDYRGHRVLALLQQVPGSPWTLLAKIDREEVLGPFASTARRLILLLVLLFALSVVLGWGVHRDQGRRLSARLERANRRFLALFDHAQEGVALYGRDGGTITVNARAREMLRIGDRPVAGLPVTELLVQEEPSAGPLPWRELEKRGELTSERRLRRADGELLVVQLQTMGLPDGRYLSILHDLTERRAAEQRERRAKRLAKLGAWEWDARTDTMHWDEETFLLLAYDPTRDRASVAAWSARVHPDDRERVERFLAREHADEAVCDFEFRILLPGGGERWFRCVGDVERDAAGAPLRIEGALQDLTSQRRAFVALEAARQQLAESEKTEAIGRLAGGIAHDFNNVVGVILGYCELTELELANDHPARPHLAEIGRAAGRAGELTRQLLTFARRQPVEKRTVDFAVMLAEARKLLAPILGESVALQVAVSGDVGAVRADPSQLTHLVLNLAINARDAMPQGGRLVISARALEIDASEAALRPPLVAGPAVELTVEDDGVGMDAETARNCFEPFFTTKGPGVGTGLGLSSVKRVLESCGGAIEVESELGRGTRFRLWFPAVASAEAENDQTVSNLVVGRGERILVVDDLPEMREVAKNALVRFGFRVRSAEGAEAAMALLEDLAEPLDLLLTDVIMPGLDGRTLAQRARELRPGLVVLFMTGYADLPPTGVPFEMPPESVIEKPFTGARLAQRVHAALTRRESAPAPEASARASE